MFIPLGQGVAFQVAFLPFELVRLPLALGLGPSESDSVFLGLHLCRPAGLRFARPMKIDHVAQRLPHLPPVTSAPDSFVTSSRPTQRVRPTLPNEDFTS